MEKEDKEITDTDSHLSSNQT